MLLFWEQIQLHQVIILRQWGVNVKASGSGSTAIGLNSTATGNFSNTFGVDIEAYSFAETVVGRFNTIYEPAGGY